MFVQGIHSKPEILLQNIRGFMKASKQIKSEHPKHEYLHIHHYNHMRSPYTSLLHII